MYEMYVKERHSNGTDLIPLKTELYSKRVITLEGKVTSEMSSAIVRQLLELNLLSEKQPIYLLITSEGGEITAGLSIYDAITTSSAPVVTIVAGYAYSMAAVLACSGTDRLIFENSKMMLHQPLIDEFGGNATQIAKLSENINKTKEKLNKIISKHTNKGLDEVDKITSVDTYFTSEEAVKFGLIDEKTDMNKLVRGILMEECIFHKTGKSRLNHKIIRGDRNER